MTADNDGLFEGLDLDLARIAARSEYVSALNSARTVGERCQALLCFYRALWPETKVTPTDEWAMDPYEIDWLRYFTPIEAALWSDIRAEGVVLYPQHPIAGYFVDFGHPVAKVAIECDGMAFHQDVAKDAARQAAIEARGWTVYRLTGSQCLSHETEGEDEDTGEPVVVPGMARQLIREVAERHGLSTRFRRSPT